MAPVKRAPTLSGRDAARLRGALLANPGTITPDSTIPVEAAALAAPNQAFLPEWWSPGGVRLLPQTRLGMASALVGIGMGQTLAGSLLIDEAGERCARQLAQWHTLALRRAAPIFLDGDLIEHAWRAEPGFPTERIGPEHYLTRYGFCVFGRSLPFTGPAGYSFAVRAISWAPVEDCPWKPQFLQTLRTRDWKHPDTVRFAAGDWRAAAVGMIHMRLWTDYEFGPAGIMDEQDITMDLSPTAPALDSAESEFHQLCRALAIAFEMAQQSNVGTAVDLAVDPHTRRRAKANRVERPAEAVRVMSLRPRLAQGLRAGGHLGDEGAAHVPKRYRYVKVCWRVGDVVDEDGNVRRKGGIRYRNPELLARDDPGDVVRVGTLPKGIE